MTAGRVVLEPRKVSDLHGADYNPRAISPEALIGLGASVKRWGLIQPLVVNRRSPGKGWPAGSVETIVAGHQRVRALLASGAVETDVVVVDLPEAEEKALNLATNSPAIQGTFTRDVFTLLAEIETAMPELSSSIRMGDLRVDLAKVLRETKAAVEGVVHEPPEIPVTQPGDLILLGNHRVYCGDSTKAEDVEKALGGLKASMVFTDPPYGVNIQEMDLAQAEVRGRRKDMKGVANDDLAGPALAAFLFKAFDLARAATRPGAVWYVCAPSGVDYRHPLNSLADLGVARHGLVWVKDRFVMGRCDYHYRHENIIYGWTPGAAHHEVPTRDQDSVWNFDRPGSSPEHPTMKPVGLVARALDNSSASGDVVYDPFLGSGTTLVACEQLGRACVGLEIDPRYVDVIVQRWETLTGKKAERVR